MENEIIDMEPRAITSETLQRWNALLYKYKAGKASVDRREERDKLTVQLAGRD